MFSTQDNAPVRDTLHGDVLELQTETEFVRNLINKPEVLRPVSDAATALLGRPVRVHIASGQGREPNEGFARLVSFRGGAPGTGRAEVRKNSNLKKENVTMAKGGFRGPMGGGMNMNMIKQAQKMQQGHAEDAGGA